MSNYAYVAVSPTGLETRGTIEVSDQIEAIKRIREMGLFPTKVFAQRPQARSAISKPAGPAPAAWRKSPRLFLGRVHPRQLMVFTRQLATLIDAGMPLLRGLRTLTEQQESRPLRRVTGDLALAIEGGQSLTEAVSSHPRVFNRLYVNMVRAGEIGGALEVTLTRLAEFMEKAQRIKGKIGAAMFYPCAVLTVAAAIMGILLTFVLPRFREVFDGLLNGQPLPAFTRLVFAVSGLVANQIIWVALGLGAAGLLVTLVLRTRLGRRSFDGLKLRLPVFGALFRKAAISRFARTLGTLVSNGVPILQALAIVRETAGNVAIGDLVSRVHENVKQGDPIAPTLRSSSLFPAMVAGMVDIGEQTGALPEMLLKIADTYDDEVDNAASALTSLLQPITIVFLAIVVGSIVIAMFLPIIQMGTEGIPDGQGRSDS